MKFSRRRIKWPAASMTSQWEQFDEDVNQILEATVKGEADGKLQAMTTIIVSMGAERFGEEEKMEGRRGCPGGRGKVAAQEAGGSEFTRQSGAGILSGATRESQ